MIIAICCRVHKVASLLPPYLFLLSEGLPVAYCTCSHLIGREGVEGRAKNVIL